MKLPTLTETCELHWASLYDALREENKEKPIHVLLEARSIEDNINKEFILGIDDTLEKVPSHPIDTFWLHVSGEADYCPNYLGSAKRIPEQDSVKFRYSDDALSQLRHELGLRLARLKKLGRTIYFTFPIMGYDTYEVTKEFAECLLSSDRKSLSIVKEKIL
ncbi:MAG: hypothetical protein QW666_02180 [Candidatus Woesearchaeota archaeon]